MYEIDAVNAFDELMRPLHKSFKIIQCGLFINKEHPFIHATSDFLSYCDCCGEGCGEVKCPITINDCNFDDYAMKSNACLMKD